jgi:hypothetical protein
LQNRRGNGAPRRPVADRGENGTIAGVHRPRCAGLLTGLLALASLVGAAALAHAREVTLPLTLDAELLRQALRAQIFTDPGETARVWDDGSGCNELVLSKPGLETQDDVVRIESHGAAKAGVTFLEFCMFPLAWDGIIEVLVEPIIEPPSQVVHFDVVDSKLLGPERDEEVVSGVVWDWVKQYVHPRLEELHVDLGAPLRDVADLLPEFLPREDAAHTRRLLESVRVASVRSTPEGLRIEVRFELEEPALGPPAPGATPEPEPPLTEAEILAFVRALHELDAFVTFVVKQTGAATSLLEIRAALLEVLLEERYALVQALASPQRSAADPVRTIFLATWERLVPILRRVAETLPAPEAVRYLSFVSAGDALRALDEVGPAAGLDVSADGLRRLARIVAPTAAGDPLDYGEGVDEELRELFGFGSPIAPPDENADVVDNDAEVVATPAPDAGAASADEPVIDAAPSPSEEATPPAPAPSRSPSPVEPAPSPNGATPSPTTTPSPAAATPRPAATPSPAPATPPPAATPSPAGATLSPSGAPSPIALGRHLAAWLDALASLATAEADAATAATVSDQVVQRLNRWAPKRADLDEYLPLVRDLLATVADERVAKDAFDARFDKLFRPLVPAVAWQESCWRQFIDRGGKLVALRSPLGSIGMMQVNQAVWRGFYDLNGLRRDIRYNARAGAEILSKYVKQYVAPDAKPSVDDVELASWAYAIYNGGPGQLRRFQKGKMGKRERAVDSSFREKFAEIRAGDALAVRQCYEN